MWWMNEINDDEWNKESIDMDTVNISYNINL